MLRSIAVVLLLWSSCAAAFSSVVPNPARAGETVTFFFFVPGPAGANGCLDQVRLQSVERAGYEIRIAYAVEPVVPPPIICTATPPGVGATIQLGAFEASGTYHVRATATAPLQPPVSDVDATFVVLGTIGPAAPVPGVGLAGALLLAVSLIVAARRGVRARRR